MKLSPKFEQGVAQPGLARPSGEQEIMVQIKSFDI